MDMAKIEKFIKTFEELTPEEKEEAMREISSTDVYIFAAHVEGRILFQIKRKGSLTEDTKAKLSSMLMRKKALFWYPQKKSEQSSEWGERVVSLVESLDFGDYSNVGDSVEYIRKQRAEQRARRLGRGS